MELPEIRYARSGDVAVAYQVVGDGPVDLVYVPLNLSIVVSWEIPAVASFYERLASFSRLILLDKRGTGISDRPRTLPTLEAQMDDVRAVLDAVGSDQAALFGAAQGAQMCALFAATYPERCSALILYNVLARWAGSQDERRAFLRNVRETWGTDEGIRPSRGPAIPRSPVTKLFCAGTRRRSASARVPARRSSFSARSSKVT